MSDIHDNYGNDTPVQIFDSTVAQTTHNLTSDGNIDRAM